MTKPKTVKKLEFQRADQLIRIVRYKGHQFFVYNHRGRYIALFDDVQNIANHTNDKLVGAPPLFRLDLEDYNMFKDENKQIEMNKDMFRHITSYVDSDLDNSSEASDGLIF